MVARSTPGASDLSLHLAARQPRQGLLTLKRVELRFPIELHAASLRTHPAGVCSILDEFALDFASCQPAMPINPRHKPITALPHWIEMQPTKSRK